MNELEKYEPKELSVLQEHDAGEDKRRSAHIKSKPIIDSKMDVIIQFLLDKMIEKIASDDDMSFDDIVEMYGKAGRTIVNLISSMKKYTDMSAKERELMLIDDKLNAYSQMTDEQFAIVLQGLGLDADYENKYIVVEYEEPTEVAELLPVEPEFDEDMGWFERTKAELLAAGDNDVEDAVYIKTENEE